MNPHASTQYAGRLLVALAAIASIFFAVGCGSGSAPTKTNPVGFSNSNLSGTYVISVSGTDINVSQGIESYFAIVGAITADGKGNITGGTVDINDPDLGGVLPGQTVSASTYSIGSDGRGTGTLKTAAGTFGLDFVLTSVVEGQATHGLISRFDSYGSGSGTIDLQGSASQSSLVSLAFSLSGANSAVNPTGAVGTVGAFTLNSSGGVTTGIQDFNYNGSSAGLTGLALDTTSSLVLTSGANGTAVLTTTGGFGSLAFDVWVIDSTHLKLIETDTTSGVALSGDAFTQQTSFTVGQLVFTLGGSDLSDDPVAAGGYATTDANGDLSAGLEDYNNAGTTGTVQPFTGSCNASAPFTAGRCQLALTAFTNGLDGNLAFAAYPSSGGVLLMEDDSLGLLQGAAFAQSATSFTAPADYGLNLSGVNTGAYSYVDDIAQFDATSAATNNMTGTLDENDLGSALLTGNFTGTYTPDSPATGRGSIAVPTTGNLNTYLTALNLEYYVVDSSTVLFIDMDSFQLYDDEAAQVAAGIFVVQSGVQSGAAARSHMSIVHPVVRPHGALRHK